MEATGNYQPREGGAGGHSVGAPPPLDLLMEKWSQEGSWDLGRVLPWSLRPRGLPRASVTSSVEGSWFIPRSESGRGPSSEQRQVSFRDKEAVWGDDPCSLTGSHSHPTPTLALRWLVFLVCVAAS